MLVRAINISRSAGVSPPNPRGGCGRNGTTETIGNDVLAHDRIATGRMGDTTTRRVRADGVIKINSAAAIRRTDGRFDAGTDVRVL